jgi:hypothetical protein
VRWRIPHTIDLIRRSRASKALLNVSEGVSSSIEKALGVEDFARTLALEIQAKFEGGRVMRFA